MSERIDLAELREFAEMARDHPSELLYSDAVLALLDAVEAARTYRQKTNGVYAKPLDVALARFDFEPPS